MPAAEKAELISFIDAGGGIRGTKPIAVLPDEYMGNIGAKTGTIQLSSDTLQKNTRHHPEITTEDYLSLQTIIENAQVIVQDSEYTMVFVQAGDKTYYAVIKATLTGRGLFMTSLRLAHEGEIEQVKKKGMVIKR